MAGVATEESGVERSSEDVSSVQQLCQSGEALVEWRSSEQVENGTPSTSPPYWDSDEDDDGGITICGSGQETYQQFLLSVVDFIQVIGLPGFTSRI